MVSQPNGPGGNASVPALSAALAAVRLAIERARFDGSPWRDSLVSGGRPTTSRIALTSRLAPALAPPASGPAPLPDALLPEAPAPLCCSVAEFMPISQMPPLRGQAGATGHRPCPSDRPARHRAGAGEWAGYFPNNSPGNHSTSCGT